MPKLPCICGHQINLSPIPNNRGFDVTSELLIEPIVEKLLGLHKSGVDDIWFERHTMSYLGHRLTPGILHIYECQECGRIAVFARESDEYPVIWYKPEKFQTPDKGKSLSEIVDKLLDTPANED